MANTKYSLCTIINESLRLASALTETKEPFIVYNGKNYDSLEEFDANEMPPEIFISKPNVTVAFAGTKIKGGIDTGEPCVVIGVEKKIDPSLLAEDQKIPSVLPDGVITDVIEFPRLHALGTCTGGGGGGCSPHDEKHRPLLGGISAIEEDGTACTLGIIVKDSTTERLVALTNNHCVGLLYDTLYETPTYGSASVAGKNMMQPSPSDGGVAADIYGTVVRAISLKFGGVENNLVDCAISSIGVDNASTPILELNDGPFPFASSAEYAVGTTLYKSGRTTGNTPPPTITITSKNVTVVVDYGLGGANDLARFTNQIAYTAASRFTQGGDSGSAMIASIGGVYKVIGLHYAGNGDGTLGIACPISTVASALSIESWNGDIVVAENSSTSIKVNDVCYERVGPTTDSITHIVDSEYSDCIACEDAGSSTSSESSKSSSSKSSSSKSSSISSSVSESPSSSSTELQTSSQSSSSSSSKSSSSKSSSSQSTSTQLRTSSSSSEITPSSSSSIFEGQFVLRAPTNLSFTVTGQNEIALRWKAMSKATGYLIERKEGFAEWQSLADVTINYFLDSTLFPGKYYQYRVRGYVDA